MKGLFIEQRSDFGSRGTCAQEVIELCFARWYLSYRYRRPPPPEHPTHLGHAPSFTDTAVLICIDCVGLENGVVQIGTVDEHPPAYLLTRPSVRTSSPTRFPILRRLDLMARSNSQRKTKTKRFPKQTPPKVRTIASTSQNIQDQRTQHEKQVTVTTIRVATVAGATNRRLRTVNSSTATVTISDGGRSQAPDTEPVHQQIEPPKRPSVYRRAVVSIYSYFTQPISQVMRLRITRRNGYLFGRCT